LIVRETFETRNQLFVFGLFHDIPPIRSAIISSSLVKLNTATLPVLLFLYCFGERKISLYLSLKNNPKTWIIWGTVGFGLFYAPLTFASYYGAAWLVAGVWQITILAGVVLDVLISHSKHNQFGQRKIPWMSFVISAVIVFGVALTLWRHLQRASLEGNLFIILPVLLASFAFPLGNRVIISRIDPQIGTMDRMLGMTIGSMPFWLLLSGWGFMQHGWPPMSQIAQAAIIAVSSGIVATWLFYYATRAVYQWPEKLAAIETTQAGEVPFTVLGSVFYLGEPAPDVLALCGLGVIVIAMLMHAVHSGRARPDPDQPLIANGQTVRLVSVSLRSR
ncbi:multidrug resistance efflux transporter family protein, partial [Acidithiobacillus sp. MC6.1]|nr:multidrug resistance efflux transporter family protein [Acidithiobacillus sp. MC6.1]